MSDRVLYLKPGDVLHVLYKGRARIHSYETVQTFVIFDGYLAGNRRHLSPKEIRDLKNMGRGSLLAGYKARHDLDVLR